MLKLFRWHSISNFGCVSDSVIIHFLSTILLRNSHSETDKVMMVMMVMMDTMVMMVMKVMMVMMVMMVLIVMMVMTIASRTLLGLVFVTSGVERADEMGIKSTPWFIIGKPRRHWQRLLFLSTYTG